MIRGIVIACDTEDCGSYCEITAHDVETALERAADKYGWSTRDGEDFCRTCTKEN